MTSNKACFGALVLLVLIGLTVTGALRRVEAQPADAGATAKKAADVAQRSDEFRSEAERAKAEAETLKALLEKDPAKTIRQEFQQQYLKMLQADLLKRRSQLTNAQLELATIPSKDALLKELDTVILSAQEKLRRQHMSLKELADIAQTGDSTVLIAKQRSTLEEYAALKREAALLRSQLRNAQVRLEIHKATRLKPGDKLSVPDFLVDQYLDVDPSVHKQSLEVGRAEERLAKLKSMSNQSGGPLLLRSQEELRDAQDMLVKLRTERRNEIVNRLRQKIRNEAETAAGQLQQEISILQGQKEEMDNEVKRVSGEAARIGTTSVEIEMIRADIEQAKDVVKMLQRQKQQLSIERKAAEDRVAFLTKAERHFAAKYSEVAQTLEGQAGDRLKASKATDLARKLVEVQREAERARAEVDVLQQRLEQEREKARVAAQEATAQRDAARQAEARARQQAEEALRAQAAARQAAEQALQEARNAADRATYAANIRAAQEALARQKEQTGRGSLEGVPDFQQARASMLRQFSMKRQELMAQLKHLDEEQQRMLEELQKKAATLRERRGLQGEPGTGSASSGQLDQILERLQGIEMRLNRLEARQRRGKE